MSKARDLADLISAGSILSDGALDPNEITGVTVSATEINRLGSVTSNVQTQLDSKVNTSEIGVSVQGYNSDLAAINQDLSTTGTPQFSSVSLSTWSITETNGHLYFENGSNKLKLDASGNLDVVGSVNSNATIS